MTAIRRCAGAFVIGGALALAAISGGCQSAHVPNPVTAKFSGDDPDAQLNFWHELANRTLTSNDDAFHGVLLFMDGSDKSANYADRVSKLKSHGMLSASFSEPANVAIERGVLARIIVKILGIKGGWALHVFPNSERYALRELVYDGIFPPSSSQQTFSGSEFVGVIGKLDDYQKQVAANVPSQ